MTLIFSRYNGFPKLRRDLFASLSPALQSLKLSNFGTPPRTPIVGRTVHERQQGSVVSNKDIHK